MPILSRRQKGLLFAALRPSVRSGWDRSIGNIRKLARFNATMNAIEDGSLMDVVRSMGISEARFLLDYAEAFRSAYLKAGQRYMEAMPAQVTESFGAVFDIQNPRAQRFLENHSSKRIKRHRHEQIEAIRVGLTMGNARGDNPRRIALNLIGRVNRATGRREGGVIGLSRQMTQWTMNAHNELRSGSEAAMGRYLQRARRDRRFDGIVKRAIREGKPVAAADADRIIARYSDRLLALRGETIARTETAEAIGHASLESLMQAVDEGNLEKGQIKRVWRSALDDRVRSTHSMMNGQEAGIDEPFEFPRGGAAMFPGDGSLEAPARELVNCRCWAEEDIDW